MRYSDKDTEIETISSGNFVRIEQALHMLPKTNEKYYFGFRTLIELK